MISPFECRVATDMSEPSAPSTCAWLAKLTTCIRSPILSPFFCIEFLGDLSYQYLEPLLADYRKLRKVTKLQYLEPLSILTLF